jgi:hypothetical protein
MTRHLTHKESIHSAGVYATVSALKAINTTSATNFPDFIWAYVDTEGEYYLDRSSSLSESLPSVVAPTTGTGRWIKKSITGVSPNNLLKVLSTLGSGGSGASLTLSSFLNEAQGADIASASTTDIGAATGNYVNVTGTTTITNLGTVQAGTRRIVNFTGALILTYHATGLILPTAANISTAAGDVAIFVSLGSGNWKCVSYTRFSGQPLIGGSGAAIKTRYQFGVLSATASTQPWTKVVATGSQPSQSSSGLGTGISLDPYLIPANCTIESIVATIAGGCVNQSGPGSAPTMRVDVYKVNGTSRTLIGTFRIPFATGTFGGFTTPTASFQTSSLTGLSSALLAGDLIGCEFVPETTDNNKLNGIMSAALCIQTTE